MLKSFTLLRRQAFLLKTLCLMIAMVAFSNGQSSDGIRVGAAGWMQYSVVGSSSDTGTASPSNYKPDGFNGKSVLSPGAQISLDMTPSERLHIAAGIGVGGGSNLVASPTNKGGYAAYGVGAYVANANFTYAFKNAANSKLSLTGGLFPYDYNPDIRNLGLYLLRGPVYPGVLISGFETKHVLPVANMLGLQLHHQMGGFQQDFLLSSEMEFYPFFDLSPAYVASYQVGSAFRIGAGVNFYHLIPVDSKLTEGIYQPASSPVPVHWTYIDTAGGASDTTDLGYAGTKLMANASFDPKPLLGGAGIFGPEDLKIYGEIGLIGLDNDKAHKEIYGDMLHRMPVMVGFNLPTYKFLDHLSLEVEWYGSANEDNLDGYNVTGSPPITPYPTNWTLNSGIYSRARSNTRDNWKWSLHGSRTVQKHVLLSFQVANDHYRPGIFDGYADSTPPHRDAVLVSPSDWYFTTKLAYFF